MVAQNQLDIHSDVHPSTYINYLFPNLSHLYSGLTIIIFSLPIYSLFESNQQQKHFDYREGWSIFSHQPIAKKKI